MPTMYSSLSDLKILIRGGGEMASGIAHRLHQCHMKVLITELAMPTAVRRAVAFAEAVYRGSIIIEGVCAKKVSSTEQIRDAWRDDTIPLLIDPEAAIRNIIKPSVVVDAILAKKNLGSDLSFAPLVIGVGPGFTARVDVHAVIESNRGFNIGRVYWHGQAAEDTGVPAAVGGFTEERVLRSPKSGPFKALCKIGDFVNAGDAVAQVDGHFIRARIRGVLRGILQDGIAAEEGVKVGDIDPCGEQACCYRISDKARAIAGGVIEAILHASRTACS